MFINVAEKLPRLMIAFRGVRQRTELWKLSRLCTSLVCCTGSSGTHLEAGTVLCLLTAAPVLCTEEMVHDRMLLLGQTSWWESAADTIVVWQHCPRLGQAEGDGQSGGRACLAFVCMLCCPWRSACPLSRGTGQQEAAAGHPADRCWRSAPQRHRRS